MNDEENIFKMLLTPGNSTNPAFWGKDLKYIKGTIELNRINIPDEFDFFNAYCSKDPVNAKRYYAK